MNQVNKINLGRKESIYIKSKLDIVDKENINPNMNESEKLIKKFNDKKLTVQKLPNLTKLNEIRKYN
jgi:hypothetical protein